MFYRMKHKPSSTRHLDTKLMSQQSFVLSVLDSYFYKYLISQQQNQILRHF